MYFKVVSSVSEDFLYTPMQQFELMINRCKDLIAKIWAQKDAAGMVLGSDYLVDRTWLQAKTDILDVLVPLRQVTRAYAPLYDLLHSRSFTLMGFITMVSNCSIAYLSTLSTSRICQSDQKMIVRDFNFFTFAAAWYTGGMELVIRMASKHDETLRYFLADALISEAYRTNRLDILAKVAKDIPRIETAYCPKEGNSFKAIRLKYRLVVLQGLVALQANKAQECLELMSKLFGTPYSSRGVYMNEADINNLRKVAIGEQNLLLDDFLAQEIERAKERGKNLFISVDVFQSDPNPKMASKLERSFAAIDHIQSSQGSAIIASTLPERSNNQSIFLHIYKDYLRHLLFPDTRIGDRAEMTMSVTDGGAYFAHLTMGQETKKRQIPLNLSIGKVIRDFLNRAFGEELASLPAESKAALIDILYTCPLERDKGPWVKKLAEVDARLKASPSSPTVLTELPVIAAPITEMPTMDSHLDPVAGLAAGGPEVPSPSTTPTRSRIARPKTVDADATHADSKNEPDYTLQDMMDCFRHGGNRLRDLLTHLKQHGLEQVRTRGDHFYYRHRETGQGVTIVPTEKRGTQVAMAKRIRDILFEG